MLTRTENSTTTYLFCGGGSGGHIYPGIAIAEDLIALSEGFPPRIAFICSDRAIDRQILEKFPYPFSASPAKPLGMRPRTFIRFLANWGKAVRHAREQVRAAKAHGPVHVVAMGGFVAATCVQAARVERVPITMVNLDAVPGKANRWMAGRVKGGEGNRIFTAARLAPHCASAGGGWTEVPPIVRAGSLTGVSREEARRKLGLDPARPVLMITGGSQGIRTVNNFALAFAESPDGSRVLKNERWQVIHQTGKNDDDAARERYRAANIDALVQPFVDHMGVWYAAADLVLCTAGAGNVAEVWANSVPALMLPYPYHKDQHQKFNAQAIESIGGVIVMRDHIDPQANIREVGPTLATLLSDPGKREKMREALRSLGPADGAAKIALALSRPG